LEVTTTLAGFGAGTSIAHPTVSGAGQLIVGGPLTITA